MRTFTRRALPGLAFAAAAMAQARADVREPGLHELAAAKGMRFGTAMGGTGPRAPFRDERYRAIVAAECGLLVAENEHKWAWTQPQEGQFRFELADAMVDWAEANGLGFRGHTLVWHHVQWLPRWVNEYRFPRGRAAAGAEALLRNHVMTVASRYRGRITSWDAINEAVDHNDGAIRETVFTRALGREAANDLIFHIARETLPDAQLVYNDYMSWEAHSATHRNGVLRLLEGFKARGVPCDALGVQGHIGSSNTMDGTGFSTQQEREWRRFLDDVTDMGYDLLITELDVHDRTLPADIAYRDEEMAFYLRDYLDLMFSYRQLKDVLVWGLADHYSWLRGRWPRADGLPKRPTPYDDAYQPKPMREAIANAFRAAAPR